MTARRVTRQTPEQKRQADINQVRLAVEALERFITNNPTDRFLADRQRVLQQQREKLVAMGAA